MGPLEDCVNYFESIGFTIPRGESPSDFFMEVVTGKIASEFDPSFTPLKLFMYWEQHVRGIEVFKGQPRMSTFEAAQAKREYNLRNGKIYFVILGLDPEQKQNVHLPLPPFSSNKTLKETLHEFLKYLKEGLLSLLEDIGEFVIDVGSEFFVFLKDTFNAIRGKSDPVRQVQPFHKQLFFLTHRAFLQVYKNAQSLLSEMLLHFGAGVFISIAVQNFDFAGAQPRAICSFSTWNLLHLCENPTDQLNMAGKITSPLFKECLFALDVCSQAFLLDPRHLVAKR